MYRELDRFRLSANNILIRPKSCPEPVDLGIAVSGLPVNVDPNQVRCIGAGDSARGSSSQGSAVIEYSPYIVIKIPVGEYKRDPFAVANAQNRAAMAYGSTAPPTMTILADSETGPKPITIQKKVDGTPAYQAPLTDLFQPQTLRDFIDIINRVIDVAREQGVYDLCGLRFKSRFAYHLFGSLPFFSDNIVVKKGGGAVLVDNTPTWQGATPDFNIAKLTVAKMIVGLCLFVQEHVPNHFQLQIPNQKQELPKQVV